MKKDKIILEKIYPIIEKSITKNKSKFKPLMSRFFERRTKDLYDTCPCSRLYYGKEDSDDFYNSLQINEKEIDEYLHETYFYNIEKFNPVAAKDPTTIAILMVIRYFYMNHKQQETELATLYLAFSGKFYPSIHSGSFPKVQPSEYRYVMEYVINHKLSNKFDIKTETNVIGAIRNRSLTWLNTYRNRIKECTDEDVAYVIQQLHDRIKSFMINIASLYYEVYNNKDAYFVYDSDDLSEDNYHIADNDSLKIERIIEKGMTFINTTSVDYKLCKLASDSNVRATELSNIIESLVSDSSNLPEIKELLTTIVAQYFLESKDKDIHNLDFISKSITPRPNSKDNNILKQRQLLEKLLTENSTAYNRRKSRLSTKSSYQKSLLSYFVLVLYNANK